MDSFEADDRYFVRLGEKFSLLLPEATVERTRDVIQITCPEADYPEDLRDYGVILLLMPDFGDLPSFY